MKGEILSKIGVFIFFMSLVGLFYWAIYLCPAKTERKEVRIIHVYKGYTPPCALDDDDWKVLRAEELE